MLFCILQNEISYLSENMVSKCKKNNRKNPYHMEFFFKSLAQSWLMMLWYHSDKERVIKTSLNLV